MIGDTLATLETGIFQTAAAGTVEMWIWQLSQAQPSCQVPCRLEVSCSVANETALRVISTVQMPFARSIPLAFVQENSFSKKCYQSCGRVHTI
jgi:hypothetical protein